jgi:hypothetical protein
VGKKHVFFRFMLFLVVCPDWLWKGQVCCLLGHIWADIKFIGSYLVHSSHEISKFFAFVSFT